MLVPLHIVSLAAMLAALASASAMAQGASRGLSQAQELRALEIEASSRGSARIAREDQEQGLSGLASTRAGKADKSVRPLVVPIEPADAEPAGEGAARSIKAQASQRAVVMRYDYATGVTTRTTVDLATGEALHVRQDVNYPTPLAREEFAEAVTLARRAVPEFDSVMKSARPQALRIGHLAPINTNPSSPRYGHRLVVLWIEEPVATARVLVDLSTNEVVPDHH